MKQANDPKDMALINEPGMQTKENDMNAEVKLNDEQLGKVVGGSGNIRILNSINHCNDPKGKCKKSTQKDKKHAWTSYKDDYICLYCDKWVHPYEL